MLGVGSGCVRLGSRQADALVMLAQQARLCRDCASLLPASRPCPGQGQGVARSLGERSERSAGGLRLRNHPGGALGADQLGAGLELEGWGVPQSPCPLADAIRLRMRSPWVVGATELPHPGAILLILPDFRGAAGGSAASPKRNRHTHSRPKRSRSSQGPQPARHNCASGYPVPHMWARVEARGRGCGHGHALVVQPHRMHPGRPLLAEFQNRQAKRRWSGTGQERPSDIRID